MRDTTQYETHHSQIPHTAPQLGQYSLGYPTFDDYQQSRRTAPASLGISLNSLSKFSSPAITPATFKLNQRLERLIRSLSKSGSSTSSHNRTDVETENDERMLKVVQFDKNWNELMHMIEFAKNLNDNETMRESMLDLSEYNGGASGIKKSKLKQQISHQSAGGGPGNLPTLSDRKTHMSGLPPLPQKKSMRTIMNELQRKLQDYKSNGLEWDALQIRVDRFTGFGQRQASDLIRRNKEVVGTLRPVVKKEKNAERIEKQKQRQIQVLQAKKILDKKNLETKLKAIKEKEKRLAQTLANEKDFLGSLSTIQAKWFSVVFVAVRVKKLQELLEKKHQERKKFLNFQHAAIVIQRWYKSFLNAKMEVARKNAKMVISYHFKIFLKKWRADRLRKASFTVQLFFKEVYDVSKLLKVVKKYRFAVIKAQRMVKSFVSLRRFRVIAITKYWDSVEGEWWSQRQKTVRGSEAIDSADKRDKKKKSKLKKDDTNQRIAVELKSKYIVENLIERRKMFYKTWTAESKAWKEDPNNTNSRHVPLFPLLPSIEEMFDMMDKAFTESRGLK